jgi:hypothetical protein
MRISFIPLVLGVCGCTGSHLYDVRTALTAEDGGVPFLPMQSIDIEKIACAQEWLEMDLTGTFQKKAEASPAPEPAKKKDAGPAENPNPKFALQFTAYTADLSPAAVAPVVEIYGTIVTSTNNAKAWDYASDTVNKVIQKKLSFMPPPALGVAEVISTCHPVAEEHTRSQVPATSPLYFNVKVPYGGTANGEIDLAPNGTLTKGISDTLPGTVVTAAGGVAEAAFGALGSVLGGATTSTAAAPAAQTGNTEITVLSVEVKIVPRRRLYTVTLTHPSSLPAAACGPISGLLGLSPAAPKADGVDVSPCRAGLVIEVKSAGAGADDKNPPSGAVPLPKPAGDKGGAP